jgi:hypothetical protein
MKVSLLFACAISTCISSPVTIFEGDEYSSTSSEMSDDALPVFLPTTHLKPMEFMLMGYEGYEWPQLNIMIQEFHVLEDKKGNIEIFNRIVTKLLLESGFFIPTPSNLFYQFIDIRSTQLQLSEIVRRSEFIGRIFGLAMTGSPLPGLTLSRGYFKFLLQDKLTLHDIMEIGIYIKLTIKIVTQRK